MTFANTNPLHKPEMEAIKGADVVVAQDPNCTRSTKACKGWSPTKSAAPSATVLPVGLEPPIFGAIINSRRVMQKFLSGAA